MSEPLNRDRVIALLNELGAERDEVALAAARELHAKIAVAGLSWQDLLQPADGGGESNGDESGDGDSNGDESGGDESGGDESGGDESGDGDSNDDESGDSDPTPQAEPQVPFEAKDEALTLIGELLAKKDISEALRQELEDYKTDIAEGEFSQGDFTYLQAMSNRLKPT